jgi:hypothetical protein
MINCNRHGVPIWVIKRTLICRVNMQSTYKSFDIDVIGNIILDNKLVSHIDKVKWKLGKKYCCIPLYRAK